LASDIQLSAELFLTTMTEGPYSCFYEVIPANTVVGSDFFQCYNPFQGCYEDYLSVITPSLIRIYKVCRISDENEELALEESTLQLLLQERVFGKLQYIKRYRRGNQMSDLLFVVADSGKVIAAEFDFVKNAFVETIVCNLEIGGTYVGSRIELVSDGRTHFLGHGIKPLLILHEEFRMVCVGVYGEYIYARKIQQPNHQLDHTDLLGDEMLFNVKNDLNLIGAILDITFIHGYQHPTCAILQQEHSIALGHAMKARHTGSVAIIALHIETLSTAVLWKVNMLPHDCLRFLHLQPNCLPTAVIVISQNAILAVHQGNTHAIPTNGFAAVTVDHKKIHLRAWTNHDKGLELWGSQWLQYGLHRQLPRHTTTATTTTTRSASSSSSSSSSNLHFPTCHEIHCIGFIRDGGTVILQISYHTPQVPSSIHFELVVLKDQHLLGHQVCLSIGEKQKSEYLFVATKSGQQALLRINYHQEYQTLFMTSNTTNNTLEDKQLLSSSSSSLLGHNLFADQEYLFFNANEYLKTQYTTNHEQAKLLEKEGRLKEEYLLYHQFGSSLNASTSTISSSLPLTHNHTHSHHHALSWMIDMKLLDVMTTMTYISHGMIIKNEDMFSQVDSLQWNRSAQTTLLSNTTAASYIPDRECKDALVVTAAFDKDAALHRLYSGLGLGKVSARSFFGAKTLFALYLPTSTLIIFAFTNRTRIFQVEKGQVIDKHQNINDQLKFTEWLGEDSGFITTAKSINVSILYQHRRQSLSSTSTYSTASFATAAETMNTTTTTTTSSGATSSYDIIIQITPLIVRLIKIHHHYNNTMETEPIQDISLLESYELGGLGGEEEIEYIISADVAFPITTLLTSTLTMYILKFDYHEHLMELIYKKQYQKPIVNLSTLSKPYNSLNSNINTANNTNKEDDQQHLRKRMKLDDTIITPTPATTNSNMMMIDTDTTSNTHTNGDSTSSTTYEHDSNGNSTINGTTTNNTTSYTHHQFQQYIHSPIVSLSLYNGQIDFPQQSWKDIQAQQLQTLSTPKKTPVELEEELLYGQTLNEMMKQTSISGGSNPNMDTINDHHNGKEEDNMKYFIPLTTEDLKSQQSNKNDVNNNENDDENDYEETYIIIAEKNGCLSIFQYDTMECLFQTIDIINHEVHIPILPTNKSSSNQQQQQQFDHEDISSEETFIVETRLFHTIHTTTNNHNNATSKVAPTASNNTLFHLQKTLYLFVLFSSGEIILYEFQSQFNLSHTKKIVIALNKVFAYTLHTRRYPGLPFIRGMNNSEASEIPNIFLQPSYGEYICRMPQTICPIYHPCYNNNNNHYNLDNNEEKQSRYENSHFYQSADVIFLATHDPKIILFERSFPIILSFDFPETPFVNFGFFTVLPLFPYSHNSPSNNHNNHTHNSNNNISLADDLLLATLWYEYEDLDTTTEITKHHRIKNKAMKQSIFEIYRILSKQSIMLSPTTQHPHHVTCYQSIASEKTIIKCCEILKITDNKVEQALLDKRTFLLSFSSYKQLPFNTKTVFQEYDQENEENAPYERYFPFLDSFQQPNPNIAPNPMIKEKEYTISLVQHGKIVDEYLLPANEQYLDMTVLYFTVEKYTPVTNNNNMNMMGGNMNNNNNNNNATTTMNKTLEKRVFVLVSTVYKDKRGEDSQANGRMLFFALDYAMFEADDTSSATNKEKEEQEEKKKQEEELAVAKKVTAARASKMEVAKNLFPDNNNNNNNELKDDGVSEEKNMQMDVVVTTTDMTTTTPTTSNNGHNTVGVTSINTSSTTATATATTAINALKSPSRNTPSTTIGPIRSNSSNATTNKMSAQQQFLGSIKPKLRLIWSGPGPASVIQQMRSPPVNSSNTGATGPGNTSSTTGSGGGGGGGGGSGATATAAD
jgi:hypothetical protein